MIHISAKLVKNGNVLSKFEFHDCESSKLPALLLKKLPEDSKPLCIEKVNEFERDLDSFHLDSETSMLIQISRCHGMGSFCDNSKYISNFIENLIVESYTLSQFSDGIAGSLPKVEKNEDSLEHFRMK